MKKVINGKLYNSESARRLGYYSYSNRRDFNFYEETLYITRSGNYFIHGEGGANSRYSRVIDQNSWSGGEDIIPIDEKTAKEWAEQHLDGNEYISIFGDVEEA